MNVKIADRVRLAVTITAGLIMVYALFVSRDHIEVVMPEGGPEDPGSS